MQRRKGVWIFLVGCITLQLLLAVAFALDAMYINWTDYYSGVGKPSETRFGSGRGVNLGVIDIKKRGTHSFTLKRITTEVWVGLEIASAAGHQLPPKPNPKVNILLMDEDGQIVIQEEGSIEEWEWATGLRPPAKEVWIARKDGKLVEEPLPGGGVKIRPASKRAHHGWGTHFRPSLLEKYDLEVSVLEPDSGQDEYDVRVVMFAEPRSCSL